MTHNTPTPPRSYFTTSFSGSARAQRDRLANLFRTGRRAGGVSLALTALVVLLAAGLVSCTAGKSAAEFTIPPEIAANHPAAVLDAARSYYTSTTFAFPVDEDDPPVFDAGELTALEMVWTAEAVSAGQGADDVVVYRADARFHTTTPDKILLVGSPTLDEDGWFTPSYSGCHYLAFTSGADGLTYIGGFLCNDGSPGSLNFSESLQSVLNAAFGGAAPLTVEELVFSADYRNTLHPESSLFPASSTLSVRIRLPQLLPARSPACQAINAHLAQIGQSLWSQVQDDLSSVLQPVSDLSQPADYLIETTYIVEQMGQLLSVRLVHDAHMPGGDASTISGRLYRLDTGTSVTLSQLLNVPDDQLAQLLLGWMTPPADSPYTMDDYAAYFSFTGFYLTDQKLVLLFPVYENGVTSPSFTLECPILLSQLGDTASDLLLDALFPFCDVPADDALSSAKAAGYVTFEDGCLTSGSGAWSSFLAQTQAGQSAGVNLASYYTLDPERCDPAYYASAKDQYPCIFFHKLFFNGADYTIFQRGDDGALWGKTYPYLVKFEGVPNSPSAAYSHYCRYVLVNDPAVTWDALSQSMYSSRREDWIDFYSVYCDLQ